MDVSEVHASVLSESVIHRLNTAYLQHGSSQRRVILGPRGYKKAWKDDSCEREASMFNQTQL